MTEKINSTCDTENSNMFTTEQPSTLHLEDDLLHNKNVVQVGNTDLWGNKYNGHDLHLYLNNRGIKTKHIVIKKESSDTDTISLKSLKNLLKNKCIVDADLIHLHLIHNTDFDLKELPLITKLIPTVITLHDPYFLTGHCIHPINCDKWKTICKDCPNIDAPFMIEFDTSTLEFLEKRQAIQNSSISAIVASDFMYNLVDKSPIWRGKNLYKLPFGINQKIFKPCDKAEIRRKLGINPNSTVIMFRSKTPFKGLDLIKSALKKLDGDITIITVDKKGYLEEFKKKFKIIEFDWERDEKLALLYQASDLFLMPSTHEAFGMMAIEAMSCGVPVISLKGTSLEKVTNAPECGICVEETNFAYELKKLISDKDELKARAIKSLEFARENYSIEKYINGMIEIYKDVIKNHQTLNEEESLLLSQLKKYIPKEKCTSIEKHWLYTKEKSENRRTIRFLGIKFSYKKSN